MSGASWDAPVSPQGAMRVGAEWPQRDDSNAERSPRLADASKTPSGQFSRLRSHHQGEDIRHVRPPRHAGAHTLQATAVRGVVGSSLLLRGIVDNLAGLRRRRRWFYTKAAQQARVCRGSHVRGNRGSVWTTVAGSGNQARQRRGTVRTSAPAWPATIPRLPMCALDCPPLMRAVATTSPRNTWPGRDTSTGRTKATASGGVRWPGSTRSRPTCIEFRCMCRSSTCSSIIS